MHENKMSYSSPSINQGQSATSYLKASSYTSPLITEVGSLESFVNSRGSSTNVDNEFFISGEKFQSFAPDSP